MSIVTRLRLRLSVPAKEAKPGTSWLCSREPCLLPKSRALFTLKEGLCFPEPPSCFKRPGENLQLQKHPESKGRAWPSLFLQSKAAGGWTADLRRARPSAPSWKSRRSHENVPRCRGCYSKPEVSFSCHKQNKTCSVKPLTLRGTWQ